jgi:hypothetical protein
MAPIIKRKKSIAFHRIQTFGISHGVDDKPGLGTSTCDIDIPPDFLNRIGFPFATCRVMTIQNTFASDIRFRRRRRRRAKHIPA